MASCSAQAQAERHPMEGAAMKELTRTTQLRFGVRCQQEGKQ
jgi:hypothetical protein